VTFTAVGSFIATDQKTFSWTPTAVGQVFALIAITTSSAQPVTAVSSPNATWVQCGTAQSLNGQSFTAWKGVATSTSAGTVTLTSAAAAGNLRNQGHAFTASGGGSNVAFDALFTMDASVSGATTSWPNATPGHGTGELLFGAEFNSGSAAAGSTSGYTYNVDATHGNGSAFNLSVGAATHPVWGDSDARSVLVMLLYEAGTAHSASASLTVTPTFSAAPSARTRSASLTVTPTFSAAGADVPPNALLLEDGTPILLEDGTPLLDESNVTGSHTASASLTVTPSFSAAPHAAHVAAASLTVTPSFSATAHPARHRTASLTVTPTFSAAPHAVHRPSASLTVAPVLAAAALKAAGAQPGYPGGLVDAKVELLLGGTWTDVTAAALPDGQQYGTIKSGQPDGAQQPSPSSMQLTLDNPDYRYSPRNSASPYSGQLRQNTPARVSVASVLGTRLRLENDNADMASVADTAALHVTGSMEIRLGVILSDWRTATLCARNDGTTPSWSLILNSDGTLSFFWYDSGGTLRHVTSPAAAGVSWRAFRVAMDASNGNVSFWLSDDIDGTWTSMGAASSGTSGAATSIRAGNSPLVIGWSAAGGTQMRGTVTGFRLYNGLSASGGTIVADAGFGAQLPGTTSWTDTAGRNWTLSGGAEISARDYRMHAELSSLNPLAHPSGGMARLQATLSGRMRRLQQGAAPAVDSAIKRAIMSQTGSLFPVGYWPMEDGAGSGLGVFSRTFGAAVGGSGLVAALGRVQPAADSSFEASAPLPTLNGDSLSVTVDSYSGATAWAVRFLWKRGSTLPASGSTPLIEITTTGACTLLTVSVNADGTVNFTGKLSSGSTAFSFTEVAYPQLSGPAWWSVEAVPSGSNVTYNLVSIAPGAGSGNQDPSTVTGHGSFGVVTGITVNSGLLLNDSVFGHLSVQKAWTSMFTLGQPLNAWRNELAADRFARVCAENGITCRILGRPDVTQAMGPQPRGSLWTVLRDCAQTEQGIVYETRDCFGLGLRTREALGAQSPAVVLDFSASSLQGDLQPADDDSGFLNDVTGSDAGGTSWRAVLDDGSANSVSEPEAGGRGRYAGSVPFPLNVADPGELQPAVAFYLSRVSVNEPRYRNVVMDLGIPGAPTADIARLRPGDLVKITNVPGIYQDSDIQQLAMGFTEAFGPGRRVTCDCIPFSPYAF
jgi:hypothetical protein